VGHLLGDANEGEDRILKQARLKKVEPMEVVETYTRSYFEDMDKLGIIRPDISPRASGHVIEQIELIKDLLEKGFAYEVEGTIYFDVSKFKDYGKLAKLKIENLEAGKRVKLGEKKNKTDFALWKFSTGKRQQEWEAFGKMGFPGWHIECSAMSSKYLGEQFDIHTGGEDHIPVHHTNEIAQSEAAFGKKPWVRFWVHGAYLLFKGEKVSKSKGGLYTISDLERKNFEPLSYRYFVLGAHYRTQLSFSIENLENAKNSYKRLKNIINEVEDDGKINENYLIEFEKAINNDLDMPKALSILWSLVRDKKAEGKYRTIEKMDSVLGLDLLEKQEIKIPKEISELVNKREEARKNKEWDMADKIRDEIKEKGYSINDTNEGPEITTI